jgi:hypothetical protein
MKHHIPVLRSLFVAFTVCMCLAAGAHAQTVSGTLQGTVTDTNGAVVANAEIVIRNAETGQERTLNTNSEGFYVAPFLPLGRYNVTAELKGFTKALSENIEITLNQTRVQNFKLKPADVSETVVVSSEETPINTTNAEIKGTLTTEQILEKPVLNQSNFLSLAEVFTGYQENPT